MVTMSTMRDSTRAVSCIGSPRPSWVSRGERKIALPPHCSIAASKATRVRVDDFSNTMPSTLWRRKSWVSPRRRSSRSSVARAMSVRNSAPLKSNNERKCRTPMCGGSGAFAGVGDDEFRHAIGDLIRLGVAQDERRQETDHALGRHIDEQAALQGHAHQLGAGAVELDADHEAAGADGVDRLVAAEGRGVIAVLDGVCRLAACVAGADGHAVGVALRECYDVGHDGAVLI